MSELTELKFSRDWTNPEDFATYEPDEAKVRYDLQFLFNEIRDWINERLLPTLTSGGVEKLDVIYGGTKPAGPALWLPDDGNLDPVTMKYVDPDGVEFNIYPRTRAAYLLGAGDAGADGDNDGGDSGAAAGTVGGAKLWFVPDVDSVGALYDYLFFTNLVGDAEASETTVHAGDMLLCNDGGILFIDKITQIDSNYYIVSRPKAGDFDPADGAVMKFGGSGGSVDIVVGVVTTAEAGSPAAAALTKRDTDGAYVLDLTIPKGDQGETGSRGADGEPGATPYLFTGAVETLSAGSAATASVTRREGTSNVYDVSFGIPRGASGEKGETGAQGAKGDPGAAATLTVGEVVTLPAGSPATATLNKRPGSENDYVLAMGIPQGIQGDQGAVGPKGLPANLKIGTVTAVPPGNGATASLTLESAETNTYVLTLGLPTGATGAKGDKGDKGNAGEDGITPTLEIGEVATLEPGSPATAELVADTEAEATYKLNLGIPEGKAANAGEIGTVTVGFDASCDFVCDGVEDNVQIQEAIRSLPAGGGTVYLNPGEYHVKQPIDAGVRDNVTVEALNKTDATTRVESIVVLRRDADWSEGEVGTATFHPAVFHYTGSRWTFKKLTFKDTAAGSKSTIHVALRCGRGDLVLNCTFIDMRGTAVYPGEGEVISCRFENCGTGVGSVGERCQGNYFTRCLTGISCGMDGCLIVNNVVEDCTVGIHVEDANNATIIGNVVRRGAGTAADYTSSQHTVLVGYNFLGRSLYGRNVVVYGNKLYGKDVSFLAAGSSTLEEDLARRDSAVIAENLVTDVSTKSVPSVLLESTTEGSVKQFKITVDDTGAITATEVTQ